MAVSLFAAVLCLSGATARLDNIAYDFALRAAARPPPPDVLIVAIDETSLAALGPWPWPRRVHSAMLRRLAAARPRAVVYDVLFVGRGARGEDAELGAAMRAAAPVYVPMLFKVPGTDGRGYDPVFPVAPVAAAATVGHANIVADGDGILRRIDLALDGETRWLHLAALAARGNTSVDRTLARLPVAVREDPGAHLRRVGTIRIAYGGPPGQIRAVPFVSVLRGEVPPAFLTGATLLVGATAPALGDQFATPVSGGEGLMSGIEIQANVLNTLRSGRIVTDAPMWARIALALAAIWLALFSFTRLRPGPAARFGLGVGALVLLATILALSLARVWLPPTAALIALIVVQPLWSWRRLSAVSDYMLGELSRLAADPDLTTRARRPRRLGEDRVSDQIALLSDTIARVRTLRSLVTTAVRSLPDPTLLVGLDGAIVLANSAARTLFAPAHQQPSAVLSAADIYRAFAGADPPLALFSAQSLADPARPWTTECLAADGSVREIRHVQWTDEAGAPLGWIVRFADITALRLAEQRREEALQLLTHDMRSPQASILALLAQHRDAVPPAFDARVRHYAERTIGLADGFLQLARAEAGSYARVPVDLADVLVEAVDDLWPVATAKGIVIETRGTDQERLVLGDRSLLTRALVNVIGNAVKFSHRGGTIACELVARGGQLVCNVSDSGVGMDEETLGKLFGRFAHRPGGAGEAGERIEGVGLGLAFVRSVARGHGGDVSVMSAPGRGSMFTLAFPAMG